MGKWTFFHLYVFYYVWPIHLIEWISCRTGIRMVSRPYASSSGKLNGISFHMTYCSHQNHKHTFGAWKWGDGIWKCQCCFGWTCCRAARVPIRIPIPCESVLADGALIVVVLARSLELIGQQQLLCPRLSDWTTNPVCWIRECFKN